MTSYYTRAKARSEIEPEDVEQGDSALVTTTITASNTTPVWLQVESMGEFESMATEMAGPMATHSQLLPEGGHPSVGGHGITGSANSPLVGVATPRYPSGPADPLDSSIASAVEGQITADSATSTSTTDTELVTSRKPPTTAEMTAAASRSPTHVYFAKNVAYFHFNSWLSFQRLCRLLWGYHFYFVDSNHASNSSVIPVPYWHVCLFWTPRRRQPPWCIGLLNRQTFCFRCQHL